MLDPAIEVVLVEPNDAFISCPISNLVLGGYKTMADIKIYNPPGLGTPLGAYSQVARVKANETLYIAGMLGVPR